MNKELCEKFPFLIPHNRFTDKVLEDWNYEYTELDAMPEGWRRTFGLQMCEELEEELERIGKQNEWRIMQIKEKFGFLHFYSNWYTKELNKIITKYEEKSKYICIHCGAPATKITTGWLSPWCDKCAELLDERTIDIKEFYE